MSSVRIPELERPAFFDGMRLDATDFAALIEYQRELRWLHNRALHGWGVATGLTVTASKGEAVVGVSAGYALDIEGHDLILAGATTLQVPPVGGPAEYYLTISYLDDADLSDVTTRAGECIGEGAVRRGEAPLLRWQSPLDRTTADARYRYGYDVILAVVTVTDCTLSAVPSTALRRELETCSKPYVAAGATSTSNTEWKLFPNAAAARGVEAYVDTSAAGFQSTPSYSAQLLGTRQTSDKAGAESVLDGILTITSPKADGFTARITMPRDLSVGDRKLNDSALFTAELTSLLAQLRWHVSWMGVES